MPPPAMPSRTQGVAAGRRAVPAPPQRAVSHPLRTGQVKEVVSSFEEAAAARLRPVLTPQREPTIQPAHAITHHEKVQHIIRPDNTEQWIQVYRKDGRGQKGAAKAEQRTEGTKGRIAQPVTHLV